MPCMEGDEINPLRNLFNKFLFRVNTRTLALLNAAISDSRYACTSKFVQHVLY